jgi:TRAP-type C4-dicarboxylate transport system substrate-binding protein
MMLFSRQTKSFLVFAVALGWVTLLAQGSGFLKNTGFAAETKEKGTGPIVLKFANSEPPPSVFTKAFEWWADEVGRRTRGALIIKVYSSAVLAKERSVLEAVRVGLADAGEVVTVVAPGKTPLATVGQTPVGDSDLYVNHKAMQDLINHYPPVQEEFKKFNQIALWTQATGSQRVISKKPVTTLEDLRGLKIRATAQMALLYKSLGASPVFIPMTEGYEGLQRGTVEAASAGLLHMESLRFHEVCKYLFLIEGIGVNNAGFGTMNLDRWNALPADVQKVVLEVSGEFPARLARNMIQSEATTLETFRASGVKIHPLSASDKKRLQETGKEVAEVWVKEMAEKGLPGAETLNFLLRADSKYHGEVETRGYPWARK